MMNSVFGSSNVPTQLAKPPSKPIHKLPLMTPFFRSSVPLMSINITFFLDKIYFTYSGVSSKSAFFEAYSKKNGSNLFIFAL